MLCFNVFWILILTVWGLIGIHTDKFGFKHVWEIWSVLTPSLYVHTPLLCLR